MGIISMIMSGLALLAVAAFAVYERKRSQKRNTALLAYIKSVEKQLDALSKEVEDLKGGVVPDYEAAKAATDAINDFNAGISSILGFDPHEAWQREKQKEKMGGDLV